MNTAWLALMVAIPVEADSPDFVRDVLPVFAEHCFACHQPGNIQGRYDMTTFDKLLAGGGRGAAIVPSASEDSVLLLMMAGAEEPSMPKDADLLPEAVTEKVDAWIAAGALFAGDRSADLRLLLPKRDKPRPAVYPHAVPISALAFDPSGDRLAVSGYHEITFWDVPAATMAGRIATEMERIQAICYSPDGRWLALAGGNPGESGRVELWSDAAALGNKRVDASDQADDKPSSPTPASRTLLETKDVVFALAFSPDNRLLAAGGADRMIRIWEVETGKLLHETEHHADWVLALAWTMDGKQLYSGSRDRSAKIWDLETASPLRTFSRHTEAVVGVVPNAAADQAASLSVDGRLFIWRTDQETQPVHNVTPLGSNAQVLRASGDRVTLFAAGAEGVVKVLGWDAKVQRGFEAKTDWIFALAVSPDNRHLASGSWDGQIRVWDLESGQQMAEFSARPQ